VRFRIRELDHVVVMADVPEHVRPDLPSEITHPVEWSQRDGANARVESTRGG
jgi:hypothetical protein